MAKANHPDEEMFTKSDSTKWWDGYCGQPVVLLDEIEKTYPWGHLLQLCDRYACSVETKGGTSPFLAKSLYVTWNFQPHEVFGEKSNFSALKRRLNLILGFNGCIYEDLIN